MMIETKFLALCGAITLLVGSGIILSSCKDPDKTKLNDFAEKLSSDGYSSIYSWTDSTGCKYLMFNGQVMTPRLNEEGLPDCPKSERKVK